jgi:hypothetical protein
VTCVVSQDLIGRRARPREWFGNPCAVAPWEWQYDPGPAGAKIIAVYARPDGPRTDVCFVVEGYAVQDGGAGGVQRFGTRIDEVLAKESVLVDSPAERSPREQLDALKSRVPFQFDQPPCAAVCGAAADMESVIHWGGQDDRIVRVLRLCAQCREGVQRSLAIELTTDVGEGVFAISEERARQFKKWSVAHDQEEHHGSPTGYPGLVSAAIALLTLYPDPHVSDLQDQERWIQHLVLQHRGDRIRQLAIAGAFCAAEIDRLKAEAQNKP